MRHIYVADVNDGFCAAIHTIFGDVIQIDCGGQKYEAAFNGLKRILNHFSGLDIFILSHFHIDHYNGLLYASTDFTSKSCFSPNLCSIVISPSVRSGLRI